MMKNVVLAFLLLCSAGVRGGEGYQATVDLTAMVDDRLPVAVTLPDITEREVVFVFPKVSPGTYDKSDFGRFVRGFQVLDAAGAPLPVKQLDKNAYRITDATNARTVRYWLEDSWEEGRGSKFVFQPGGTNFEAGKNFVLNHHGMFGYVQGYKNRPFEVTYQKPDGFYGATALPRVASGAREDRFRAATYFELADNPILYCVPDTVSYDEGGVRINIAVYAATGQTKASVLLSGIRKATRAIRTEFPDMPLDSYSFLFYLFDVNSPVFKRGGYAAGALEHHRSSLYYLPDIYVPADSARLTKDLLQVVTHEFLHIITPLNLHSELISDFDFYDPVMSRHLWLYEGITEYFAVKLSYRYGLIDFEGFQREVRQKIALADRFKDGSFTEMSANVLQPKYHKGYQNVYYKGALLGLFLDITLLESTKGKTGLVELVRQLSNKYGAERPFPEDGLFAAIGDLTNAQVAAYIDQYIQGDAPLPLEAYLEKIGLTYAETSKETSYDFPDTEWLYYTASNVVVANAGNKSPFGKGEFAITHINGEPVTLELVRAMAEPTKPDAIQFRIEGSNGPEDRSIVPKARERKRRYVVDKTAEPTDRQQALFEQVLGRPFQEGM